MKIVEIRLEQENSEYQLSKRKPRFDGEFIEVPYIVAPT